MLISEYGKAGRNTALPLVDLRDGRHVLRYVSAVRPALVDIAGRRVVVEPPSGSIVRVQASYQPMLSGVGLIPVMRRVVLIEMAEEIGGLELWDGRVVDTLNHDAMGMIERKSVGCIEAVGKRLDCVAHEFSRMELTDVGSRK